MTYSALKQAVIECIYSRDLKDAMIKEKCRFSAKKLMFIAYRFARNFDERLNLLEIISEYTNDEKLKEYKDADGGVCYGVNLTIETNVHDEYYIIPLHSTAMKYKNYDDSFDYHEHLESPWVENADISELKADLKERYIEYIDYLKKTFDN